MKRILLIALVLLGMTGIAQDIKPVNTNFKNLQSPSFGYYLSDSTVWVYKGAYGWTKLAGAKQFQHKIDSLALHSTDTLQFYRLLTNHDSLSNLDEKSYSSLTEKPDLAVYRLLTNHDSLSRLDEKDYASLTGKPDLTLKVDKTTTVNGHALNANVTVTKADVILGNVTNDSQVKRSEMATANGVATLDANGKLPTSQVPSLAITDTYVVTNPADRLALTLADRGDVAIVTSENKSYILQVEPYSIAGNWKLILTPTSPVNSVNGQTGNISLTTTDISEGTRLYYTDARVGSNSYVTANTAKVTNATHTGDAAGSTTLTLATVNSNIGTFNNVTINAKGLATGGSNVSYAPASGSANYVQVSPASAQAGNIWMGGSGTFGGNLQITKNGPELIFDDNAGGTQKAFSVKANGALFTITDFTNTKTIANFGNSSGNAFIQMLNTLGGIGTYLNSEGASYFNGGNTLFGTVTDNTVDKLQVNGSISSTGYKLNGSDLFGNLTANYLPVWDGGKLVNSLGRTVSSKFMWGFGYDGGVINIKGNSTDGNGSVGIMQMLQNSNYNSANNTGENKLVFAWGNHYAAGISGFKYDYDKTGIKLYTENGYNNPVNSFELNVEGLKLSSATPSTSPATGALTVAGGLGVGGALNVGGNITAPSITLTTGAGTGKVLTSDGAGNASWAANTALTNMGKVRMESDGEYAIMSSMFTSQNGAVYPKLATFIGGSPLPVASSTISTALSNKANLSGAAFTGNISVPNNSKINLVSPTDPTHFIYHSPSDYEAINTNSAFVVENYNGGGAPIVAFKAEANGNVTATNFILSSDRNLKQNIEHLDFSSVGKIKFVQFTMKSDTTNRKRAGVIAQDVEKIAPEFVHTDQDGIKSVAYIDLLIVKIAELESRIVVLENQTIPQPKTHKNRFIGLFKNADKAFNTRKNEK